MVPVTAPVPRVTAADVAARAATNVSSVSLVVNGKHRGRVSDAVATRVREAVEELGYVVDHSASALARGSGDLVVLVAPDLWNPYYSEMIAAVRDALGGRYRLMLSVTERGEQPGPETLRRSAGLRPAGFLVAAPDAGFAAPAGGSGPAAGLAPGSRLDPGVLADPADPASSTDPPGPTGRPDPASRAACPVVFLDAPGLAGRPEAVNYDCTAAVRDLAALLAERGHRTVAYLDAATRSATFRQRRELLGEALAARGLRLLCDEVRAELDVDSARSAAGRHLARWRGEGATAVVGAADTLAYGVLSAAREAGTRVPEDLGVAGFDDLPSSAITAPALTSISLPGAVMGRVAAERLLAALEGRGTPDVGMLGARLVRRESL